MSTEIDRADEAGPESVEESNEAVEMTLEEQVKALTETVTVLEESLAELRNEFKGCAYGYEEAEDFDPEAETDEERATRVGVLSRVADIERLVHGRNRSAPVKRNMVDEDARRVLVGDAAPLGHKEAGELVGLTYAQVYSCRLEYTFKHVLKELRESGWKNPWSKSRR